MAGSTSAVWSPRPVFCLVSILRKRLLSTYFVAQDINNLEVDVWSTQNSKRLLPLSLSPSCKSSWFPSGRGRDDVRGDRGGGAVEAGERAHQEQHPPDDGHGRLSASPQRGRQVHQSQPLCAGRSARQVNQSLDYSEPPIGAFYSEVAWVSRYSTVEATDASFVVSDENSAADDGCRRLRELLSTSLNTVKRGLTCEDPYLLVTAD